MNEGSRTILSNLHSLSSDTKKVSESNAPADPSPRVLDLTVLNANSAASNVARTSGIAVTRQETLDYQIFLAATSQRRCLRTVAVGTNCKSDTHPFFGKRCKSRPSLALSQAIVFDTNLQTNPRSRSGHLVELSAIYAPCDSYRARQTVSAQPGGETGSNNLLAWSICCLKSDICNSPNAVGCNAGVRSIGSGKPICSATKRFP